MSKKTPCDFPEHADWIAYVRQLVPEQDQTYALADGRTELFVAFYCSRGQMLPAEFKEAREAASMLTEPERTAAVEALNEQVMADLTHQLLDQASFNASAASQQHAATPREHIDELLAHLVQKNAAFALVRRGPISTGYGLPDAEFISAMADLDKLLSLYRDRNNALPPLTFERAWFLHYLHEPERSLQTRAVLHMLTEGLNECMSA